MSFKQLSIFPILLLCLLSMGKADNPSLPLIPFPKELMVISGHFNLNNGTKFLAPKELKNEHSYLTSYLKNNHQIDLQLKSKKRNEIIIKINKSLPSIPGSYQITSDANLLKIEAYDESGVFYGIQTIIQLLQNGQRI